MKNGTIRGMAILVAALCLIAASALAARPRLATLARGLEAKLPPSCRLIDEGVKMQFCGHSWYAVRGHRYDKCRGPTVIEPVPGIPGAYHIKSSSTRLCKKMVYAEIYAEDAYRRTRNCVSELVK